jgi:DNA-binding MarR family transcriptional regulator
VGVVVNQDHRLVLEHQVCFSLAVASREVISLYRPLLEPLGLTHPQYLVMLTLWQEDEPVSVKTLSERLKLEPPTLSPLLKRLQKAGLIERHRDPADERSLRITLTPRGHELREVAVDVPPAVMERLGMSIDELVSLRDTLMDVIDHASSYSGERRTPISDPLLP